MKTKRVLQVRILERFMTESALKNLVKEYNDNRAKGRHEREVNDQDLMVLADYRKGLIIGELSKKYRVSRAMIHTSLRLAALSKLK